MVKLRWPEGFVCPRCQGRSAWTTQRNLLVCSGCQHQASLTAGTIFQDTRKPLVLWFRAIWWVTAQKNGASALGLQRILGLGSYFTAWTWLHKLRRAMVRPGRDRLRGRMEVDETYVGGLEEGKRGRRAETKALIAVACGRRRERDWSHSTASNPRRLGSQLADVHPPGDPAWQCSSYWANSHSASTDADRVRDRKLFYRLLQQAVAVEPVPYKRLVGGSLAKTPEPQPVDLLESTEYPS